MGLISDGIEKVTAYRVPVGISEAGEGVAEPGAAIVRWHSRWNDKLHQVYVNGKFCGTSCWPAQRQMLVPVAGEGPFVVQVVAVDPAEWDKDFSGELQALPPATGDRAVLAWPRWPSYALGDYAHVCGDGGSGTIDYDNPLTDEPIELWPEPLRRWGFGTDAFGRGDFGYSSNAAPGLGAGGFGFGPFGCDAELIRWRSEPLEDGQYLFAVRLFDRCGNADGGSILEKQIDIVGVPSQPTSLQLDYDCDENRLTLSWSAQQ